MQPCDCHKEAIRQQVIAFAACPYGWDGGDALPIRPDVLSFSTDFLFADGSPFCLHGLGMPEVHLNPDGTVEITITHDDRELNLTLACEGVIAFIQLFPDGETRIEGTIRCGCFADCIRLSGIMTWIGVKDES